MMTQNFSFSRILSVWLVLFAFLCGMILPSVAIARQEMAIATEGDPDDGLDSTGGGGGGSESGDNQSSPYPNSDFNGQSFFGFQFFFENQANLVVRLENQIGIILVFPSWDSSNWGGWR